MVTPLATRSACLELDGELVTPAWLRCIACGHRWRGMRACTRRQLRRRMAHEVES